MANIHKVCGTASAIILYAVHYQTDWNKSYLCHNDKPDVLSRPIGWKGND